MATITVDAVVSALPSMNRTQLKSIQQCLKMLIGEEAGSASDYIQPEGFEAILFQAVVKELEIKGIRHGLSFSEFRKSSRYNSWRSGLREVELFIKKQFKGKVADRTTKLGLCRLLVSTLLDELKERQIPVAFGTVVTNVGRLPEVFNDAFPGYLDSGLAFIVATAMQQRGIRA